MSIGINALKSLIFLQLLSCYMASLWTNNQTLIDIVNGMNSTWTAGENGMVIESFGPHKKEPARMAVLDPMYVWTPKRFDARRKFKRCRSVLRRIRSQGRCASSWAVSTVSMLSDRTCIASRGSARVHLSAEDVMTCCSFCRDPKTSTSCSSANPTDAVYFWMREGIVTGGEPGSGQGCKPYSKHSYAGGNLPCKRTCSNRYHWKEYDEDKHKGKMVYMVKNDEDAIRSEIFKHGPVTATFRLSPEFAQYAGGVYRYLTGNRESTHSIKLLGWGEQNGTKFWLGSNCWGVEWGINGFVKFLRGENDCEIEQWIVAGRMFDPGRIMRKAGINRANGRPLSFVIYFIIYDLYMSIFKQWL